MNARTLTLAWLICDALAGSLLVGCAGKSSQNQGYEPAGGANGAAAGTVAANAGTGSSGATGTGGDRTAVAGDAGASPVATCEVGSRRCAANNVEACMVDGSWVLAEACATSCADSTCVAACSPGARRCTSSGYREQCSSDSTWVAEDFACTTGLSGATDFSCVCGVKAATGQINCFGAQAYAVIQANAQAARLPKQHWVAVSLSDEPGTAGLCALDQNGTAACASPSGVQTFTGPLREVAVSVHGLCTLDLAGAVDCSTLPSGITAPKGSFTHISLASILLFGLGTDRTLYAPTFAFPSDNRYLDVTTNGNGACVVRVNGAITCIPEVPTPTALSSDAFVQVALEYSARLCARRSDGSVACWGSNQDGAAPTVAPIPSPPGEFSLIVAMYGGFCGLKPDGATSCWGDANTAIVVPPDGW